MASIPARSIVAAFSGIWFWGRVGMMISSGSRTPAAVKPGARAAQQRRTAATGIGHQAAAAVRGVPPPPPPPSSSECPICLERPKDTLLIPCGHVLCKACGERMAACPICRADVKERNPVYW